MGKISLEFLVFERTIYQNVKQPSVFQTYKCFLFQYFHSTLENHDLYLMLFELQICLRLSRLCYNTISGIYRLLLVFTQVENARGDLSVNK